MKSFDTNGDFKDNYKLLIGSILPRPIAAVSTLNSDGSNNLAPFSFFTGISAKPMIVAFCPLIRSSTGEIKDTVKNIHREKEFVINFVSESISDKINKTSTELPYGEDEFIFSGLTPIDSEKVKAKI
jgi:flavin reductase (DIM6/NTAB) family NADH-FMN oxidoreductase RutF